MYPSAVGVCARCSLFLVLVQVLVQFLVLVRPAAGYSLDQEHSLEFSGPSSSMFGYSVLLHRHQTHKWSVPMLFIWYCSVIDALLTFYWPSTDPLVFCYWSFIVHCFPQSDLQLFCCSSSVDLVLYHDHLSICYLSFVELLLNFCWFVGRWWFSMKLNSHVAFFNLNEYVWGYVLLNIWKSGHDDLSDGNDQLLLLFPS